VVYGKHDGDRKSVEYDYQADVRQLDNYQFDVHQTDIVYVPTLRTWRILLSANINKVAVMVPSVL